MHKICQKNQFFENFEKFKNFKKTHISRNNLLIANNFIFLPIRYRFTLKFLDHLVELFRFYGIFHKHNFKKSDLLK